MDKLIFIDTNIFLDFYRVRGGETALSLLNHIDVHHDKIITSSQVEMEYKKNRQRVILQSLNMIRTPDWGGLTAPAFLSEAKPIEIIKKDQEDITQQLKKIKTRTEGVLKNPLVNDSVYKVLQRLFKGNSKHNLSRDNKIRFKIRRLAWKRFMLGYPPRKDNDISLGDAINWEWIIHCAIDSKKDVVIVSRDSDYGVLYDKKPILNDWLAQEFKARISQKRKIILTDKLAEAFKLTNISISKKEENEEEKLIDQLKQSALFHDILKIKPPAAQLLELLKSLENENQNISEISGSST